jgi:hypothetical protein
MYTNQQPPNWSSSRTETEAWAGRTGQPVEAKSSSVCHGCKGLNETAKKKKVRRPFISHKTYAALAYVVR